MITVQAHVSSILTAVRLVTVRATLRTASVITTVIPVGTVVETSLMCAQSVSC